jgi:hypothetical protein
VGPGSEFAVGPGIRLASIKKSASRVPCTMHHDAPYIGAQPAAVHHSHSGRGDGRRAHNASGRGSQWAHGDEQRVCFP